MERMKLMLVFFIFLMDGMMMNVAVSAQSVQMTEKQKIEYLIQSIEKLDGAKFYRNGEWHSAQEAADHLRLKLKNAGNRLKTARQFIDRIASESSITGKAYKIKFKDGNVVESKIFLNRLLSRLEQNK